MAYTDKEKQKAYAREYYQRNKEAYAERLREARPAIREKSRQYLREYLQTHPCVDCGEADIRVLQFDHRESSEKTSTISRLLASPGLLEKEIAKCDVRCANCHMRRTAEQFGWERLRKPTVV